MSFVAYESDRIGIVGQNGSGKSTLMKIIAGVENPDGGSVDIKKNSVVSYLSQHISDDFDERICKDILLEAFKDILNLESKLKNLENEMTITTDGDKLEKLVNKYSRLQEEFISLGGYDIETKINYILSGLKIDKSFLETKYNILSGGEKTLIQFAQILLSEPDILLLDEPTNHLDIRRMEWLEGYLSKYKGTVILISHDRYFLDKVTKNIYELEDKNGTMFKGNYSSYLKQKEELDLKVFEEYKNQQKMIQGMKEAIKRLKDWGEKGDNPAFFRRANAIQKRVDFLEKNGLQKPKFQKPLPINFSAEGKSSNECIVLENYGVKFGDREIFKDVNFKFFRKDKVALIGDNGTGKSTLLKSVMNQFNDYTGNIKIGNVKIGYFEQIITFENPEQTVLDYYMEHTLADNETARRTLTRFYFYKDNIFKRVKNLSGGEKIRLKLSVLLKKEVNMLIFDEPTNHIDITTREILEESLSDFKGTMILVSHDRYFLDKLATKVVEIRDKNLKEYDGNYT